MFHKIEDNARDIIQMNIIPLHIEYNKTIENEIKKIANSEMPSINDNSVQSFASQVQVK